MNDPRAQRSGLRAGPISHLVVETADAARAREFYAAFLGAASEPDPAWPVSDEIALHLPSGQRLVLRPAATPRTLPDAGVHQAYRAGSAAIARITEALCGAGITLARYREDRPEEAADNRYFADPDGNRIQLVAAANGAAGSTRIAAIDHAAVEASDMEWQEAFYVDRLGLPVAHRVGWNTADYVRARAWAEGKEEMAPGTRRWDQRYRDIPGGKPGQDRRVARPNPQLFLALDGAVLGIFMAQAHHQEPPPDRAQGSPRTAFAAPRGELDRAAGLLEGAGVAARGPVEHPAASPIAASLYFRDPCGNFLELTSPAQGRTGR